MNYFKPFKEKYNYVFFITTYSAKYSYTYNEVYEKINDFFTMYFTEFEFGLNKDRNYGSPNYTNFYIKLENCKIVIRISADWNEKRENNCVDINYVYGYNETSKNFYDELTSIINKILTEVQEKEEKRLKEN